jgi:hypothetical protein
MRNDSMAKPILSADRLRELFHYDQDTGLFTRRAIRRANFNAGAAGTVERNGYVRIEIDGKPYRAHRLAWLYVHGVWPTNTIDHINAVRADNRIGNLRDVVHRVNNENARSPRRHNKSGYLGVIWNRQRACWQATIGASFKKQVIGFFDMPEDAHQAYLAAKRRLHEGCTI